MKIPTAHPGGHLGLTDLLNHKNIHRRTLLAVAVAGVAGTTGCFSDDNDSDDLYAISPLLRDDIDCSAGDALDERSSASSDLSGIKPWALNPRYWEYRGEPIILLGATDNDSLFQWGQPTEAIEAQLRWEMDGASCITPDTDHYHLINQLDRIARSGGNFVRNTMNTRRAEDVYPFHRRTDGLYDLDQWNDEYWTLFDVLLEATYQRDIIVQIELWDGHNYQLVRDDPNGFPQWDAEPFNPKNNINYTEAQTILPTKYTVGYQEEVHPFLTSIPSLADDKLLLRYQEKFAKEVLLHAFEYDHVLYCVQNESWADQAWSNYWKAFIHRTATNEAREHVYVSDMRRYSASVEPVTQHGFDYAEVSQSGLYSGEQHHQAIAAGWEALREYPVPMTSTKQYGSDEREWTDGSHEGIARLWRSLFSGQAAVRNHRPPYGLGQHPSALNHIRSLRIVADLIEPPYCLPHHLAERRLQYRSDDECYLLVNPGRMYAIYFPNRGDVRVDVSEFNGRVSQRWLMANRARWTGDWQSIEPESADVIELTPSETTHMVAVITSATRPRALL